MFFDVTYKKKELEEEIAQLVGTPLSFWERIKMGGSGSQRFQLTGGTASILALMESSSSMQFCNIEIRSEGVVIWFRIKLENYLLAIPYRLLTILKKDDELRISGGEWKLLLFPAYNAVLNNNFVMKMLRRKAEYLASEGGGPP